MIFSCDAPPVFQYTLQPVKYATYYKKMHHNPLAMKTVPVPASLDLSMQSCPA